MEVLTVTPPTRGEYLAVNRGHRWCIPTIHGRQERRFWSLSGSTRQCDSFPRAVPTIASIHAKQIYADEWRRDRRVEYD